MGVYSSYSGAIEYQFTKLFCEKERDLLGTTFLEKLDELIEQVPNYSIITVRIETKLSYEEQSKEND